MNLSTGPLDSPLWIIVDCPDNNDLSSGKPFSGFDGRFFTSILRDLGVPIDQVRVEFLTQKSAPKGEFRFFEANPELMVELNASVSELKARIKEFSPNMVLLLGPNPLKYITLNTNINDWRGHYVWDDILGVKTLATYKPSVAIRQKNVAKENKPGQYEALLIADIKKAVVGMDFHDCNFPTMVSNCNPTFEQAMEWIEDIKENAHEISYDIETINKILVDCIGFAYTRNVGYCIPLWYPNGKRFWKNDAQFLAVFRGIKEILESDIPKIAQNSQFDTVILKEYYKIDVRNIVMDTMLFAHNLYCDLPKDLGTLMSLYANIPYHKQDIKDNRWEYNAHDVMATLHVRDGMMIEDQELGVKDHYYRITNPAIRVLVDNQHVGVAVNDTYRQEAISHELQIKTQIMESLDRLFPKTLSTSKKPEHKFSPGSSQQKRKLFYDMLGIRKKYNKGAATTDKNFLRGLIENHKKDYVKVLAEACLRYSEASSTASQLSTPLYNGRMHTSYTLGGVSENGDGDDLGTDTGRLASKRSYFPVQDATGKWVPAGTNLQNRKKGHQRRILTPDNDSEEFCLVDLWAAEAFFVALDAQEAVLLDMLNSGVKIHNWLWEKTLEAFLEECKLANYGYKNAKQSVHLMNYDGSSNAIAKASGLPQQVSDWQYGFYHNKFPGIRMRMRRIDKLVRETRSITSFLGRKIRFIQPWGDELLKRAYAWGSQSAIGELAIHAMTKIWYQGRIKTPWMYPALNTHDGLAIRCIKGNRDSVTERVADAFNVPITKGNLTVRIPVEITWGSNFNDAEKDNTRIIKYTETGWELTKE